MSYRTRLLTALTAVGVVVLLLVVATVDLSRFAPPWLHVGRDSRATADLGSGAPQHLMHPPGMSNRVTLKVLVPELPDEVKPEHQFASYDRIVVEVHRDGSMSVLGKVMPMDAFRSLLGDQQQDGVKTVVAIHAENDCIYQYVSRVIRLCDDLGIPHLTVAEPPPSGTAVEAVPRT